MWLPSIIKNPERSNWSSLCERPAGEQQTIRLRVQEILAAVKSGGDQALQDFTAKFDGVSVQSLIQKTEGAKVSSSLASAIALAASNIEKFHRAQVREEELVETSAGVFCWRKTVPVQKVGIYIPGGSAPLFSSLLMLAIPAVIAGAGKIIVCTPPDKLGQVPEVIRYTASVCGIKEVFVCGGAQAIAAMAYGTETVPAVDKIFGPGNQWVNTAKQLVQTEGLAIDLPAGPSEVLIIADAQANPDFVAADLLSQAEHGPDSQTILLSNSSTLISSVQQAIKKFAQVLPRKDVVAKSLKASRFIQFESIETAFEFSNCYAPEHLIINTEKAAQDSAQVINAGSVFLGGLSCESAGDYASGTNHTLPTGGYARAYSGVSLESFQRKITFQRIEESGARNLMPAVIAMAEAESLDAHALAARLRLESVTALNAVQ